ncbi:hypothetical protein EYZ11_007742 [Aspergillus tanneri]|nr:hypothetical protein EYZ11_007742 [Aspergillus tanneri]
MSSYFLHMDNQIFPEPEKFNPDRWILADERGERLFKFIGSFTKGSRICLGIHLAYAEIYLALAAIVRRFDIELYETTAEDIRFTRDLLGPRSEKGVWKVQARVTNMISK